MIYISSSWKNRDRVRSFANALRALNIPVYDFTDPTCRDTPEIPPERFPEAFDPAKHKYEAYLRSIPEWKAAVECNRRALDACSAVVLLLPCGPDAHADWAYAVGRGKFTLVVGSPKAGDRTPTHLWANAFAASDEEALAMCPKLPIVMGYLDGRRLP